MIQIIAGEKGEGKVFKDFDERLLRMKPKKKRFPSRIYRDSWDLDTAFYKWLLPRLKCYREYANGYFKNFP